MIKNLQGYINVLDNIEFWKYNFHIFYKKYNLKFRNTGNGGHGPATLKIFGVTPEFKQIELSTTDYQSNNITDGFGNDYWPDFVRDAAPNPITPDVTSFKVGFNIPSREYLVYSEIRSSNLENWSIVIPEISKGWGNLLSNNSNVTPDTSLYPGFEYDNTYGTKTWNEVQGLPKEISLPKAVRRTANIDFAFGTSNIPNISSNIPYVTGGVIPKLPINLSQRLSSPNGIQRIYNLYGYHPAIRFYADYDDPYRTKFYDWLPLGVEKYKVVLELSTGESVATTFF
jgi:hypothetical protein